MKLGEELLLFLRSNEAYMNIALCVLLVIAGFVFHFVSKRWITSAFQKRAAKNLISSKKVNTLIAFLISTIKYIGYFFIFYLFCKVLNLQIDSFFIAVAGASSVAVGLGAQTLIKNVINGFFILMEDQYSVGDVVMIGDYKGVVEEIGLRTTIIKSIEGNIHIIPNGDVSVITNLTQAEFPSIIDVNMPYDAEAERVISVLDDEMDRCVGKIDGLRGRPRVLGISSLGQYCYTIKIQVKSEQSKYLGVERQIRYNVKKRFDQENMPMPAYQPFASEGI